MELIPVKPRSLSLLELLNIANEAYPDGFLGTYFDSKTGERIEGHGDSLARFVVAELSETFDPKLVRTEQLGDRFVHVRMVANPQDWIEWAIASGVAPEVITFLRVRPEMLDTSGGQEQTEQLVTPSPRSWARVSNVLTKTRDKRVRSLAVNGLVGESVAVQFFHTLEEIGGLPPIEKLLSMRAPEAARSIPATLTALYGLTYSLVRYVEQIADHEKTIELFDAVAGINDNLPRREIQSLGMELLLGKAHRSNLFQTLTKSKIYRSVYHGKAQELVEFRTAA
jgi:hypothetical protein